MVLGKPYIGPEVDVWSLGVMLYALLCGHLPFHDHVTNRLYEKIVSGTFEMEPFLSPEAQDLLRSLLTVDSSQRATLEQASRHPWMMEGLDEPVSSMVPTRPPISPAELDSNMMSRLTSYGFTDMEEVKRLLLSPADGPCKAVYHLLCEKNDTAQRRAAEIIREQRRLSEEALLRRVTNMSHEHSQQQQRRGSDETQSRRSRLSQRIVSYNAQRDSRATITNTDMRYIQGGNRGQLGAMHQQFVQQMAMEQQQQQAHHALRVKLSAHQSTSSFPLSPRVGSNEQILPAAGATPQSPSSFTQPPPHGLPVLPPVHMHANDVDAAAADTYFNRLRFRSIDSSVATLARRFAGALTVLPDEKPPQGEQPRQAEQPAPMSTEEAQAMVAAAAAAAAAADVETDAPIDASTDLNNVSTPMSTDTSRSSTPQSYGGASGSGFGPANGGELTPATMSLLTNMVGGGAGVQEMPLAPEDAGMRQVRGLFNVATSSSRPARDICAEVARVLEANGVRYQLNAFVFHCWWIDPTMANNPTQTVTGSEALQEAAPVIATMNHVSFNIEICKIQRLALYGLHLNRVDGDTWLYKQLCDHLTGQMRL